MAWKRRKYRILNSRKKLLDFIISGDIILDNNIIKSYEGKSSLRKVSREKNDWWKFFMQSICENRSRTVMLKNFVSVAVCLR